MKRIYIISLLLCCCLLSRAQQSLFDKYAEMDGVTSVYISKSMLSLIPQGQTSVNGVQLGDISSRLDNIQILSCDEPDIITKLRKETSAISSRNGYEELMKIREDGDKTTIYYKDGKKKEKKEFILLSDQKDEFTIITIVGDLTLQEIQGIIKKDE